MRPAPVPQASWQFAIAEDFEPCCHFGTNRRRRSCTSQNLGTLETTFSSRDQIVQQRFFRK